MPVHVHENAMSAYRFTSGGGLAFLRNGSCEQTDAASPAPNTKHQSVSALPAEAPGPHIGLGGNTHGMPPGPMAAPHSKRNPHAAWHRRVDGNNRAQAANQHAVRARARVAVGRRAGACECVRERGRGKAKGLTSRSICSLSVNRLALCCFGAATLDVE